MASRKKLFRKIKKIFRPSIGRLLFFITLAYFVFTFYSYNTRATVSYYEVEEGSLVKEHNYQGLILRSEQIVNSEANGYIYFFVADGRKAAKGSPVYSIDEGGRLMEYINNNSDRLAQLNSAKIAAIRAEILNYSRSFSPDNFRALYNIKNTLDAHITEYASMNIFSSLLGELSASGIEYKQFNSEATGIVCTYTDGLESVTEDEINEELFNTENYVKQTVKSGDLVTGGDPVYKLITDEAWELVFAVNETDAAEFNDGDTVKISFPDKGFTVRSKIRFITGTDGKRYGVIDMDSYVIQFTSDRFINFEIVTNDVSGLKIPDKAVTSKDFYVIPAAYVVTDDNGNRGFNKAVISDSGTAAQFVMPDIYNIDDEYAYIDCDDKDSPLKPGDYVMADVGYTSQEIPTKEQIASEETLEAAGKSVTEDNPGNALDEQSGQESGSGTAYGTENAGNKEPDGAADEGADVNDAADNAEDGIHAEESRLGESQSNTDENEAAQTAGDFDSQTEGTKAVQDGDSLSNQGLNAAQDKGLYQINSKRPLKGAYNVNKGYTVFKKVEILESANGYSIVKKNSSYGLQVYDHIVLDAAGVHDGQLLYR